MPIRYRIHRNLQIVHTVIDDQTDSVELRAYSDQFRRDPDFENAFDHMIEFSEFDSSSSGAAPAQILSHLVPPIAQVKMAIVAPGALEFGIAEQFQAIYELFDDVFAVFRDQAKALDWFGLQSSLVEWRAWRSVLKGYPG